MIEDDSLKVKRYMTYAEAYVKFEDRIELLFNHLNPGRKYVRQFSAGMAKVNRGDKRVAMYDLINNFIDNNCRFFYHDVNGVMTPWTVKALYNESGDYSERIDFYIKGGSGRHIASPYKYTSILVQLWSKLDLLRYIAMPEVILKRFIDKYYADERILPVNVELPHTNTDAVANNEVFNKVVIPNTNILLKENYTEVEIPSNFRIDDLLNIKYKNDWTLGRYECTGNIRMKSSICHLDFSKKPNNPDYINGNLIYAAKMTTGWSNVYPNLKPPSKYMPNSFYYDWQGIGGNSYYNVIDVWDGESKYGYLPIKWDSDLRLNTDYAYGEGIAGYQGSIVDLIKSNETKVFYDVTKNTHLI